MLKCPNCLTSFDEGMRFCAACGSDLSIKSEHSICPKCGNEFPAGTSYCNIDGTPLNSKKPVPRCSKCGKEYPVGINFCPADGAKVTFCLTQPRSNRTIIYASEETSKDYPETKNAKRFWSTFVNWFK